MSRELKTQGEFNKVLNNCYRMVINNMKETNLIKQWDGEPTGVTAEEHFDNIVKWCRNNIKSRVWSCHKSAKMGFRTSYGAKHNCEKELKCYVANNWMKLAMIWAGLQVCRRDCVEYDTEKVRVKPVSFQDIITGNINFICRNVKYNDDPYYKDYNCIYPFEPQELKYIN